MLKDYHKLSGSARRHTEECRPRIITLMEGTEDEVRIRRSVQKSEVETPREERDDEMEMKGEEIAEEKEEEREGKRAREEDEPKEEEEPKGNSERESKRRKLQVLMSEKEIAGACLPHEELRVESTKAKCHVEPIGIQTTPKS